MSNNSTHEEQPEEKMRTKKNEKKTKNQFATTFTKPANSNNI